MKAKLIIALSTSIVACSIFAAATESARLEKQLRSDLHVIIKRYWPAQKVSESGDAHAEKWLTDLKTSYPDLLRPGAEPTLPLDEQLQDLNSEASRLHGSKPTGEIWRFYQENWRAQSLNAEQKIIFARFLSIVIASKRESQEGEIRRVEAQLENLKKLLPDVLARFSEDNPRMKEIRAKIAELEAELAKQRREKG